MLEIGSCDRCVFNLEQDVQGSLQGEVDVQKNIAGIVAAGGGPVLAAG